MDYLEKMFDLQKILLEHYITIEGLPQYPVDLNEKPSQRLIKDFVGRLTEEMAEAYEQYEMVLIHASTNNPREATVHIYDAYEEVADCLHFLLEILLYCNIDNYTIHNWLMDNFDMMGLKEDDPTLYKSLLLARLLNNDNIGVKVDPYGFSVDNKHMSNTNLQSQKILLWEVVYKFNLACNQLKMKEWVQEAEAKVVNQMQFQNKILQAYIAFICYLQYMGFTEEKILEIYEDKNKTNHLRILNGY